MKRFKRAFITVVAGGFLVASATAFTDAATPRSVEPVSPTTGHELVATFDDGDSTVDKGPSGSRVGCAWTIGACGFARFANEGYGAV